MPLCRDRKRADSECPLIVWRKREYLGILMLDFSSYRNPRRWLWLGDDSKKEPRARIPSLYHLFFHAVGAACLASVPQSMAPFLEPAVNILNLQLETNRGFTVSWSLLLSVNERRKTPTAPTPRFEILGSVKFSSRGAETTSKKLPWIEEMRYRTKICFGLRVQSNKPSI